MSVWMEKTDTLRDRGDGVRFTTRPPSDVKNNADYDSYQEVSPRTRYRMETIVLESRDNDTFEVDEDVAFEALAIQAMSQNLGPKENPPMRVFMVPLSTKLLKTVIEHCKFHVEWKEIIKDNPALKYRGKEWDAQYANLDFPDLCDLLLAASYMDVPYLVKLLTNLASSKMPRRGNPKQSTLEENRRSGSRKEQICEKKAESSTRENSCKLPSNLSPESKHMR